MATCGPMLLFPAASSSAVHLLGFFQGMPHKAEAALLSLLGTPRLSSDLLQGVLLASVPSLILWLPAPHNRTWRDPGTARGCRLPKFQCVLPQHCDHMPTHKQCCMAAVLLMCLSALWAAPNQALTGLRLLKEWS